MTFLKTSHQRKSIVITGVILLLLLIGIFNFGMQYLDPPAEYGVAINFGDSNIGNGKPLENTKKQSVKKQLIKKDEEKNEPRVKESTKQPTEKILTQKTKVAPTVKTSEKKEKKTPIKKEVKKVIPKKVEKPKPSKATQDALNNLLKGNANKGKPSNEGDDLKKGVKGTKKGDPKSTKYYGNNGKNGNSNYNLSGRNTLARPIEKPDCNEEGIVVVSIEVDRNGKVIKATPGVRGTTNTSPCLLKPAKTAALKTTWNPDKNAPTKQIGTIIYKFSLSE